MWDLVRVAGWWGVGAERELFSGIVPGRIKPLLVQQDKRWRAKTPSGERLSYRKPTRWSQMLFTHCGTQHLFGAAHLTFVEDTDLLVAAGEQQGFR